MSATIDGNGVVTLAGDGFGVNWGRKQLIAAPSSAVKMQLVFRNYLNTVATSSSTSGQAWDHCWFFGIGFTNEIYSYPNPFLSWVPDKFFGWCNHEPPAPSGVHQYASGGFYSNATGSRLFAKSGPISGITGIPSTGFSYGTNLWLNSQASLNNAWSNTIDQHHTSTPANPTVGAEMTTMWEVYGSLIDNSVYGRLVRNIGSLAEGDAMFGAVDTPWNPGTTSLYEWTIHGNTTSNWRNAGSPGTMNFPRWLKFKYPEATQSHILKYWKIRYLDATDTVVREQAIGD